MKIQSVTRYSAPSFTSDIHTTGLYDFWNATDKYSRVANLPGESVYAELTPLNPKAFAEAMSSPATYVVVEPKNNGVFHCATNYPDKLYVQEDLKTSEGTRALVVGGSEAGNDVYYKSTIAKLQVDDVPTSYMVGQKKSAVIPYATSLGYNLTKDKYTLCVAEGKENGKVKGISTIEQLAEHFRYFFIDKGDRLFINGELIPYERLSKFFKLIK